MFDSNKALDKNILKSSLQILWGGPFDWKDQWSWWQFSWKNSNYSTQIAGWSNAWEIVRTIKIAKPSAVRSPHLLTNCQRIPDHVGESDCWSRRSKLSRLWFMWHLPQTGAQPPEWKWDISLFWLISHSFSNSTQSLLLCFYSMKRGGDFDFLHILQQ